MAFGINLVGTSANNTLVGTNFDDFLDGAAGADRMVGRGGNDFYFVDNAQDIVDERGGYATDIDWVFTSVNVNIQQSGRFLGDIENIVLLGTDNISVIFANQLDNLIYGNSGDNSLSGAAGNDTIYGNEGTDTLTGGFGNDTLDGGTGDDNYDYRTLSSTPLGLGTDTITDQQGNDDIFILRFSEIQGALRSGTNLQLSLTQGNVNVMGQYTTGGNIERIWAQREETGQNTYAIATGRIGSNVADLMAGTNFDDILSASGGNDLIFANGGNDTVNGGSGRDIIHGGKGNDRLFGDGEADRILGGTGEDTLVGGEGFDRLEGGLDSDTYEYRTSATLLKHGEDTIFDEGGSADMIRVDDLRGILSMDFIGDDLVITMANAVITIEDQRIAGNTIEFISDGTRTVALASGAANASAMRSASFHDLLIENIGQDDLIIPARDRNGDGHDDGHLVFTGQYSGVDLDLASDFVGLWG